MRSAKVTPISDDPHFADYAEFVHTEEGPVEQWLREDKAETWQFRAALMTLSLFVAVYVIPALWRWFR